MYGSRTNTTAATFPALSCCQWVRLMKKLPAEVIPEKDATVLVYCRSGNRSKTASSTLADLGYTNIYEFSGINTWPYDTEP